MNDFGPKRPMSESAETAPTDTAKAKRGRPKKKPDYDRENVRKKACTRLTCSRICDILESWETVALAALIIANLYTVSSRQQSKDRLRCEEEYNGLKYMKNIDKRKLIITLCTIVAIVAVGLGIFKMLQLVKEVEQVKDYNTESLRWAIIGAIGSWTGSVFGAIALVVSLVALWLPQRVKIAVGVSTGFILSQIPGIEKIDAYIITVKNTGMKPVTVTNVYLHFGSKKQGDIFVGMLNRESILQMYTPRFPKRLDRGESFDYYLLRERLDKALIPYEEKMSLDEPFSIRIDEVTRGTQYYKTKWTLRTFIGK